jgi:aldehyde oxidoreductase
MDVSLARTHAALLKAGKPVKYEGTKKIAGTDSLDPVTGQGASFESDVHNIQMAEVEVDIETGETRVIKMTTAVDAGTILHPQNLEGQLEGGMDQGSRVVCYERGVCIGKTKDWITF